nr:FAD-dependent oxidoreductase [Clostridium gasigenes]
MPTAIKYIQQINPTYEERLKMLRIALEEGNHIEDFDNLVELLGPPKDITTISSPEHCKGLKVGVIGGGLSGLASAFELRKLGFDITIFESEEKRIGGRVHTHYFDKNKRFYGELGAMRIPVSHGTTWHYIDLFGLKTRPFIQNNENAFIYVRNKRARNDPQGKSVMEKIYPEFNLAPWERSTPWQKLIGYALGSNLLKIHPDIRKELVQIKKKYSNTIEYMDSLSIRQVLEKMNLSEGAIEMLSCVAPFAGYFYYNNYYENLQEEYTVDYAYRYELVDGFVNLPLAFYNSLMSKKPKEYSNIQEKDSGKILWKNGKTVTGIYKKDKNNRVILQYKNKKSSEIFQETFDFIVCTIPFSSLRNVTVYPMFSTEKMQAIKEVNYASAQKTVFMCNKRFWEEGDTKEKIIGGGSHTDLSVGTIWYNDYYKGFSNSHIQNKKISNNNGGVLLASYNLNQDSIRLGNLEDKTRVEEIKRQIESIHGLKKGYLDSIVDDFKTAQWNNEKGFYGGFCYANPGHFRLFSYAMAKPEYENRVYFAGEHVSSSHAWMQGAVNSAMKAANDIAEYCEKG